jgi:hypothetical protein
MASLARVPTGAVLRGVDRLAEIAGRRGRSLVRRCKGRVVGSASRAGKAAGGRELHGSGQDYGQRQREEHQVGGEPARKPPASSTREAGEEDATRCCDPWPHDA